MNWFQQDTYDIHGKCDNLKNYPPEQTYIKSRFFTNSHAKLNNNVLSCKTNMEQTNDSDPIFSQQGGVYSSVIILIADVKYTMQFW